MAERGTGHGRQFLAGQETRGGHSAAADDAVRGRPPTLPPGRLRGAVRQVRRGQMAGEDAARSSSG